MSDDVTARVEFRLDSRVNIPGLVVRYDLDEHTVWLAPEIPSWIVTIGAATKLFASLHSGQTLKEAITSLIRRDGVPQDRALAIARQVLAAIEQRAFYQSEESEAQQSPPPPFQIASAHFTLTHRCNFSCFYCYADGGKALAHEMEPDDWKRIIRMLREEVDDPEPTTITFSGGEPLLYPNLLDIARAARQAGFPTMLLTNGSKIMDVEHAGALKDVFNRIQVSLDGPTKESFERCRGKGSYEPTVRGIDLLFQAGVRVEFATMVLPENIDDIEAHLIDWFEPYRGKLFDLRLVAKIDECGRARKLSADYFRVTAEHWNRVYAIMRECQDRNLTQIVAKYDVRQRVHGCGIGLGLAVDADGSIYPCTEPHYCLGKYPETHFRDIVSKLRVLFETCGLENMPECARCDFRYICGGGCRVKHHKRTGSLTMPGCSDAFKRDLLREMIFSGEPV